MVLQSQDGWKIRENHETLRGFTFTFTVSFCTECRLLFTGKNVLHKVAHIHPPLMDLIFSVHLLDSLIHITTTWSPDVQNSLPERLTFSFGHKLYATEMLSSFQSQLLFLFVSTAVDSYPVGFLSLFFLLSLLLKLCWAAEWWWPSNDLQVSDSLKLV